MTASPKLGQTLLENQAGNVTLANTFRLVLDALAAGGNALDRDLLAQPGSPAEGDLYILPESGTLTGAAWSTFTNGNLALFINGAWVEITAKEGVQVYVADEDVAVTYSGATWTDEPHTFKSFAASSTVTQGQGPITRRVNRITTSGGANHVVTLPAAAGGKWVFARNAAGGTLTVFPASGDEINDAGVDTSVTFADGTSVLFFAIDGVDWYSLS